MRRDFLIAWKPLRGPELDTEVAFARPRRWREEIHNGGLIPVRIAIELEGGISTGGGHVRGAALHWTAMTLGWPVFRLPGSMLTQRYLEPIIQLCRD